MTTRGGFTVTTTKFLLGLALGVGLPVWLTQTSSTVSQGLSTLVTLDYATFKGLEDGALTSFLGMPFAVPPIGNLRFARPKPPRTLPGVHNATKYGNACYAQILSMRNQDGALVPMSFPVPSGQVSEDCLTVNVIKPANTPPDAKLPVLFSIHGGGFAAGTTSAFDFGVPLVTRAIKLGLPMIYVSANYRLTAFGFLPGEEVSEEGNMNAGLYDQRMALEWVQKYIEHFGGDPDKVVLVGSSAGSISVGLHMVAEGAQKDKLFRGAIMRSAAPFRLAHHSSSSARRYINLLAHHAGCSPTSTTTHKSVLSCLRALPAKELSDAINKTPDLMGYESVGVGWLPRLEEKRRGNLWSEQPWKVVESGRAAKVPFVITANDDEGTMFSLSSLNVTTNEQFVEYVQFLMGADRKQVEEIAKMYPEDPAQGSPFGTGDKYTLSPQYKRISALINDLFFHVPHLHFLENLARKQGVPAWTYVYKVGKNKSALGSYHMMDTGSVLLTESGPDFMINFANTLNPNLRPIPNPLQYLTSPALFVSSLKSLATIPFSISSIISDFTPLLSRTPFSNLFPNHTTLPYYWPSYASANEKDGSERIFLTFHDASREDAHPASKKLGPGVPEDVLYKEQNEDTGRGNLGATMRKPRLWKVGMEVGVERAEAKDLLISVVKGIKDE